MPNAQCELTGNFTRIPNDLINDPRLSARARALLQYLLSKPADWKLIVEDCARALGCCVRTARKAIADCIRGGYLDHRRFRSGKTSWTWRAVSTKPLPRRAIQRRFAFMNDLGQGLMNGVAGAAKMAGKCLNANFAPGKICLDSTKKESTPEHGAKSSPKGKDFAESVSPVLPARDVAPLEAAPIARQQEGQPEAPKPLTAARAAEIIAAARRPGEHNPLLDMLARRFA